MPLYKKHKPSPKMPESCHASDYLAALSIVQKNTAHCKPCAQLWMNISSLARAAEEDDDDVMQKK